MRLKAEICWSNRLLLEVEVVVGKHISSLAPSLEGFNIKKFLDRTDSPDTKVLHSYLSLPSSNHKKVVMAKRHAEDKTDGGLSLKSGKRPQKIERGNEEADFEDEFEDEFESEDEIIEAGVHGGPDSEREAEEKGTWTMLEARCECTVTGFLGSH
ncbi:MAG: hypothetical protein Q9217_001369 [Psora testacea]